VPALVSINALDRPESPSFLGGPAIVSIAKVALHARKRAGFREGFAFAATELSPALITGGDWALDLADLLFYLLLLCYPGDSIISPIPPKKVRQEFFVPNVHSQS
jgi:hypothetical protein